jgi:di/tricarboxylate transporter
LFGRQWGEWKMSLASRKKSMTWIAIFLMIAAMAMYVLSDDESLPPQELEERTGAVALTLGRV